MMNNSLLDLYKKIKDGTASDEEKMWFEVRVGMHSLPRDYIIAQLEADLEQPTIEGDFEHGEPVGEVFDTLTEKQKKAVRVIVGDLLKKRDDSDEGKIPEFATGMSGDEYEDEYDDNGTEIIHCRDCKHYYFTDNRIPQEQRYICDFNGDGWKPDDFCSYAERKEDG